MKIKIVFLAVLIVSAAQPVFAAEIQTVSSSPNFLITLSNIYCHPEEAKPTKDLRSFASLRMTNQLLNVSNSRKTSSLDQLLRGFQAEQIIRRSA